MNLTLVMDFLAMKISNLTDRVFHRTLLGLQLDGSSVLTDMWAGVIY